jgi:hypothetical protein
MNYIIIFIFIIYTFNKIINFYEQNIYNKIKKILNIFIFLIDNVTFLFPVLPKTYIFSIIFVCLFCQKNINFTLYII